MLRECFEVDERLKPPKETIRHVSELLSLMSALTNDPRFEDGETVLQGKQRRISMCDVLDKAEERGMKKGLAEGRKEGRLEGALDTLFGLVNDGILTVKDAAARAGVSTSTFSRKMKAYKG